jgi:acyl carrier protein
MRAFERIMMASESLADMPSTPIVMPVTDWSRVLAVLGGRQDPQFQLFSDSLSDADEMDVGADQALDKLRSLTEDEQLKYLTASLKTRIAIGFGFDETELSIDESLVSLGMDSLLAVQLKMALHKMLGVDLPLEVLLEGASISELASAVLHELANGVGAGEEKADTATAATEQVSMVL